MEIINVANGTSTGSIYNEGTIGLDQETRQDGLQSETVLAGLEAGRLAQAGIPLASPTSGR